MGTITGKRALVFAAVFGGALGLGTISLGLRGTKQYSRISRRSAGITLSGWRTDTSRRIIELDELQAGGPGKDGIPAIRNPRFEEPFKAGFRIRPNEPVISLVINGEARAYPLQILIWHEIVNDRVGSVPVAVTFCPLCYSAIVYDRRIGGRAYTFGVSGMLRNSGMVMYDHDTETLWQQMTGVALVGEMVGSRLRRLPSQIISFAQFRLAYDNGRVLTRDTGHGRFYGRNPYAGYDDISKTPFRYSGPTDDRLLPMEKIVAVKIGASSVAYPYSITAAQGVINDTVDGVPVAVFHGPGAVSALDRYRISTSRRVGSTGVFVRHARGAELTFRERSGEFVDEQTGSIWDITGYATAGQLKGTQLKPIVHGDYFAFAWLVFEPDTEIYRLADRSDEGGGGEVAADNIAQRGGFGY